MPQVDAQEFKAVVTNAIEVAERGPKAWNALKSGFTSFLDWGKKMVGRGPEAMVAREEVKKAREFITEHTDEYIEKAAGEAASARQKASQLKSAGADSGMVKRAQQKARAADEALKREMAAANKLQAVELTEKVAKSNDVVKAERAAAKAVVKNGVKHAVQTAKAGIKTVAVHPITKYAAAGAVGFVIAKNSYGQQPSSGTPSYHSPAAAVKAPVLDGKTASFRGDINNQPPEGAQLVSAIDNARTVYFPQLVKQGFRQGAENQVSSTTMDADGTLHLADASQLSGEWLKRHNYVVQELGKVSMDQFKGNPNAFKQWKIDTVAKYDQIAASGNDPLQKDNAYVAALNLNNANNPQTRVAMNSGASQPTTGG